MVTLAALWHRLYDMCQAQAKGGLIFSVQKQPLLVPGGTFLALEPHFDMRTGSHEDGRKSAGDASTSSPYPKKKVCHRSPSSSPSTSSIVQVGKLPEMLYQ